MKKITERKARELMSFPKNFDFELVDQQYGFEKKIFSLVEKSVFEGLENTQPEVYDYLVTAGLHYSFVLSLPRIKVHLSNYGINQYEQGTTKNASWWDVRDLALGWIKKADFYLGKALNLLRGTDISFFRSSFSLVSFSDSEPYFGEVSSEVYLRLSQLMNEALADLIFELKSCTKEILSEDDFLRELVKKYCISKSKVRAVEEQGFLFTSTGIVVQYEELPWQKSVVLTEEQKSRYLERNLKESERNLVKIWNYLNENRDNFPCLEKGEIEMRVPVIAKKGGLFL